MQVYFSPIVSLFTMRNNKNMIRLSAKTFSREAQINTEGKKLYFITYTHTHTNIITYTQKQTDRQTDRQTDAHFFTFIVVIYFTKWHCTYTYTHTT